MPSAGTHDTCLHRASFGGKPPSSAGGCLSAWRHHACSGPHGPFPAHWGCAVRQPCRIPVWGWGTLTAGAPCTCPCISADARGPSRAGALRPRHFRSSPIGCGRYALHGGACGQCSHTSAAGPLLLSSINPGSLCMSQHHFCNLYIAQRSVVCGNVLVSSEADAQPGQPSYR